MCLFCSSAPDEFGKELLAAHNKYRAQHGAPPLQWSSEAASKAKSWVSHIASKKVLEHGNHEGMGQNIANKMSSAPDVDLSGQEAVDMWYNEIKDYDYNNPGFAMNTGHFTQVVWAETTQVGAAKAKNGNAVFVVANYLPPGNVSGVSGSYERNVKKKS